MNITNQSYAKLTNIWILLKITYGLLFVVAGADKFFNFIVTWEQYINPLIFQTLNIDYNTLKIIIAVIEIGLGLLTLSKWTRVGAYGIATWFLIIVANLLIMWKYLDIAARDVVLAIGAITLAILTDIKDEIK